jgi:hypothetical protein
MKWFLGETSVSYKVCTKTPTAAFVRMVPPEAYAIAAQARISFAYRTE